MKLERRVIHADWCFEVVSVTGVVEGSLVQEDVVMEVEAGEAVSGWFGSMSSSEDDWDRVVSMYVSSASFWLPLVWEASG